MKKVSLILFTIFLALVITGCSSNNIILTEDESNAIAQYCAYLLLKYDNNHTDDMKLLDTADLEAKKQALIDSQPTPKPTKTPEEENAEPTQVIETPVPTEAVADGQEITGEDSSNDKNPPLIPDSTCQSIAEALGVTNFELIYKNYRLVENYLPAGEYFSLSAPEGKTICVIEIDVKNITAEKLKFDALNIEAAYSLTTVNNKIYSAETTLLTNDLKFYNADIKAGKTETVALIFYISPEDTPLYLKINGTGTYILNLN